MSTLDLPGLVPQWETPNRGSWIRDHKLGRDTYLRMNVNRSVLSARQSKPYSWRVFPLSLNRDGHLGIKLGWESSEEGAMDQAFEQYFRVLQKLRDPTDELINFWQANCRSFDNWMQHSCQQCRELTCPYWTIEHQLSKSGRVIGIEHPSLQVEVSPRIDALLAAHRHEVRYALAIRPAEHLQEHQYTLLSGDVTRYKGVFLLGNAQIAQNPRPLDLWGRLHQDDL